VCDAGPGSSPRPTHQDPLFPETPPVRRGLQQLYPEVRVRHMSGSVNPDEQITRGLGPECRSSWSVCPLQCAVRLRGAPEAAEGARWNEERS